MPKIDLRARTAKRVLNIEVTNIENEIRRQRHPIGVCVFSIRYRKFFIKKHT
jgi:hypothetical protein